MSLQSLPEIQKHDPDWLMLVKAVEQLAAAASLDDIIAIVRNTARDISGADGVCFVLKDGDKCHYVDENAIAPLWKGKRFSMNACIAGWAMRHDQTAAVSDVYSDPRVPVESYRPTFIKSMVLVPIRIQEPVGAIGFYWSRTQSFEPATLALTEALARSTSAAFAALKAREEAQESEQRLAMALEAGRLGAFELHLITGKAVATPACAEIFRLGKDEELSRRSILARLSPEDQDKAVTLFSTGINSDAIYRVKADGVERRIEMWGRLRLDENARPVGLSAVVRDVTEQLLAKERLEEVLAELLRASRLNDLGAMASALAHELNQPLAAGSNYLKAAERLMAKDPAKAMDAMAKAGGQFIRTREIIQRIRGFVGQTGALKMPEDLEQVCHEVLELTATTTRHAGAQIYLKLDTTLPRIAMDKVQIQQVLVNLLRNAIEAMEEAPRRHVTLSAKHCGETVEISVADSGKGLAPEIAAHLFQPFHTTKEGGMGVGLSLCRKIVEAHGGRLRYEPSEEGGAKFVFSLPIAADA